jgi:GNAT superfamily N-acetyltransferase
MTDAFIVRPITPEDYQDWRPLWDAYNAFYGRKDATALPESVTETTWARFFDATEPVHALVCVSGREMVGLAHYLFHRSTSAIEPSCYLQDLFTVPARRGQGIARRLISGVSEAAQAGGTARLYWHTHMNNRTAQKLYDKVAERSGFIVYRKTP